MSPPPPPDLGPVDKEASQARFLLRDMINLQTIYIEKIRPELRLYNIEESDLREYYTTETLQNSRLVAILLTCIERS